MSKTGLADPTLLDLDRHIQAQSGDWAIPLERFWIYSVWLASIFVGILGLKPSLVPAPRRLRAFSATEGTENEMGCGWIRTNTERNKRKGGGIAV